MDMPAYFKNTDKFNEWMIILQKHLDEGDFKTKKWCGKILERFAQNYCNPSNRSD